MATIAENITIIKNSIDRMKEALNLPSNTPLEDLTLAVEDGGGSGGGGSTEKSDIYKVKTIAERDAIVNMVEGDTCVVQESTIANITATTEFQTAICPATVVLPAALTDYIDLRFNAVDTDKMFDCTGNLDSNYFMMDCYTDTGSIRIEYTSNDGITYTRNYPTEDNIDFGTPIVYSYPDMWNDVIGYFLQAGNVNFEGIFVYKDGKWEYANIGVSTSASNIIDGNKAYTSNGIITGTFIDNTTIDELTKLQGIITKVKTMPIENNTWFFNGYEQNYLDVSTALNTSEMTTMYGMFASTELKYLDLSQFDTSKVTDMGYMFSQSLKLEKIIFGDIDTSQVTSMSHMFNRCPALVEADLNNFNTAKVQSFENMFAQSGLIEFDLKSFDTSNATTMKGMFNSVDAEILDLSSFTTNKVTNMTQMFYACSELKHLDIRNFDFTNVTTYTNMFGSSSYPTSLLPADCLIIVKDDTARNWLTSKFTWLANIKTVAEIEAVEEPGVYNAYEVSSIEERDAIANPATGDTCVVINPNLVNMTVTDTPSILTIPSTVVLPSAWTGSGYLSLRDPNGTADITIMLSATSCRIDIYTATNSMSITFTSADGITYTRTDSNREIIDLGVEVSCDYVEEWNEAYGYFLLIDGTTFNGLYTFKNGVWDYTNIGIPTKSFQISSNSLAYTNKGTIEGTMGSVWDADNRAAVDQAYSLLSKVAPEAPTDISFLYSHSYFEEYPSFKLVDTSNVTNMRSIFLGCTKLKKADLSHCKTSKATNMMQLFKMCPAVEEINMKGVTLDSKPTLGEMFIGCSSLKKLDISTLDFTAYNTGACSFKDVPADCLVIVKNETCKTWVKNSGGSHLTNVKTVAEYEG